MPPKYHCVQGMFEESKLDTGCTAMGKGRIQQTWLQDSGDLSKEFLSCLVMSQNIPLNLQPLRDSLHQRHGPGTASMSCIALVHSANVQRRAQLFQGTAAIRKPKPMLPLMPATNLSLERRSTQGGGCARSS